MLYTEILTRKVELWIFPTRFTPEKTPQNNFSSQNFSVENNYLSFYRKKGKHVIMEEVSDSDLSPKSF